MSLILTIEEAAEYLRLSPHELMDELESKRLPGAKIAGKWRIKKDVLDRIFENNTDIDESKESVTEPEKEVPAKDEKAEIITEKTEVMSDSSAISDKKSKEVLITSEQKQSETKIAAVAEQKSNETLHDIKKGITLKSIYTPSSDTVFATCVRGRIFAYDPKKRYGHAWLADGRVVWIDAK
ncbi:MAG TPA: helix-turn-helix domain-containing protein, partial [Thermodesulfovibrionia bacterium]|nr:helix-turn-helix domain-containing protein [Thermodesulfovibrionia bacterium]